MFSSKKRIFIGKSNLQQEPLCPYLSDKNGYLGLRHKPGFLERVSQPHRAHPTLRGGTTQF